MEKLKEDIALFEKRGIEKLLNSQQEAINAANREIQQMRELIYLLVKLAPNSEVRISFDMRIEKLDGELRSTLDEKTNELVYQVIEKVERMDS